MNFLFIISEVELGGGGGEHLNIWPEAKVLPCMVYGKQSMMKFFVFLKF